MSSVFHAGEIEVQRRAGVRAMAKRVGNGIHDALIRGAAEFLAEEPMLIVGYADRQGQVWASVLTGAPGFARAVDERTISITANPAPGDPLASVLADHVRKPEGPLEVGLLVIDLETRERMRLNGPAEVAPDGSLLVQTREVYFNCPKYIQAREVREAEASGTDGTADSTGSDTLTPRQCAWIAAADTFFIASAAPGGGADASHRGGNPGFVRVRYASTLEWPDYSGNTMFNTLGNITANPNAGLLFLDFERGDVLQLTGKATVIWEPERAVQFRVTRAIEIASAVPLHFRFLQYSRFNPA